MFNGKMIARNGIEIHENDKLRAVYLENEQFGNDIILVEMPPEKKQNFCEK